MERLQILWVGRSHTLADSGVKTHSHPYYHMFYIEEGSCVFTAGDQAHQLQQGQCILVPPGIEHSYSNRNSDTMAYLEIKFTLPQTSVDNQLKDSVRTSDNTMIGLLFQQIVTEYSQLGSLADDAAASYLRALLSALTQQDRYGRPRQFRYIDASSYSPLSQQIIRYLEKHYAEDISLDTLAAIMGYNKSYLCVAFKKNTHSTILDCLNMIRIRRAAELIVYSDHSLTQVADMCGFASDSHFNRVFYKYVGVTPGQCRRAYPMNILFGSGQAQTNAPLPNRFMYSVLAQKQITPQMIRGLDASEKK